KITASCTQISCECWDVDSVVKRRAFIKQSFYIEFAVEKVDELVDEIDADSSAAVGSGARAIQLSKHLKDRRKRFVGHPNSRILHFEFYGLRNVSGRDGYAAFFRKFDGVIDKIL